LSFAYPSNTTTGFYDMAIWVNSVTSGYFWSLILLALFAILFFSFKAYPTTKAYGSAAIITMFIGILMGSIALIPLKIIILCIIIGATGVVALRVSGSTSY